MATEGGTINQKRGKLIRILGEKAFPGKIPWSPEANKGEKGKSGKSPRPSTIGKKIVALDHLV